MAKVRRISADSKYLGEIFSELLRQGGNETTKAAQEGKILSLNAHRSAPKYPGGAKKVSIRKVKVGNKNQKPFEKMMIMVYELNGIGKVKMTVGVRRRTKEKVQYCITAISSI